MNTYNTLSKPPRLNQTLNIHTNIDLSGNRIRGLCHCSLLQKPLRHTRQIKTLCILHFPFCFVSISVREIFKQMLANNDFLHVLLINLSIDKVNQSKPAHVKAFKIELMFPALF